MSTDQKVSTNAPVAFISYSWTTPEHEEWVLKLAARLVSDGVEVLLDKWLLQPGNDQYAFMERILDPKTTNVIVICDKKYTQKANGRVGGVGIESQIITQESYAKVVQSKFIAIVRENEDSGKPSVPIFYGGKIHISMRTLEEEMSNYETLVRALFNKPLHVKPKLGTPPAFITSDNIPSSPSYSKFLILKEAVLADKRPLIKGLLRDYLKAFEKVFPEFAIHTIGQTPYDELIVQCIQRFTPLRDELLNSLHFIAQYTDETHSNEVIAFFERMLLLSNSPGRRQQNADENFSFLSYELFLYAITFYLLEHKWKTVDAFLSRQYIEDEHGTTSRYRAFYPTTAYLEERNRRLGQNRTSIAVDMIHERATHSDATYRMLLQTDLLLYLRSMTTGDNFWYPRLYMYADHTSRNIPLLVKGTPEFDALLTLLHVSSPGEVIEIYKKRRRGHDRVLEKVDYDLQSYLERTRDDQ